MRLQNLRITNCFGFTDTTIDLTPNLVYVLGRNSSGKTAILTALSNLSATKNPGKDARAQNFNPIKDKPFLRAMFTLAAAPEIRAISLLERRLKERNVAAEALERHGPLANLRGTITEAYATLTQELGDAESLHVARDLDGNYYLSALQPVFDAIGLNFSNHVITNDKVILTEGLTDYLFLRGLHDLVQQAHGYEIAPARGEGSLFTIIPFFISQGIALKIILDTPGLKPKLEESYGIPDSSIFTIPGNQKRHGIEDLFTPTDFLRLLNAIGDTATLEDLHHGNSNYTGGLKRLVAQAFRNSIAAYASESFEDETRANIDALLAFCGNDDWFRI